MVTEPRLLLVTVTGLRCFSDRWNLDHSSLTYSCLNCAAVIRNSFRWAGRLVPSCFMLNELSSLELSSSTALEDLGVWNNKLASLDLSANTALEDLAASGNQLTSLNLSNNTALTSLSGLSAKMWV